MKFHIRCCNCDYKELHEARSIPCHIQCPRCGGTKIDIYAGREPEWFRGQPRIEQEQDKQ